MRILRVLPAVLLAAAVLPLTTSPPAYAKGATAVVVSGPGVDEVTLRYTRDGTDVDVNSLAEASGLYQLYGSSLATEDPGLTDAELGPRYVLTWRVHGSVMATSHVYPFATDGAWAHILDDEGGWVRGGPDLEQAMVDLGAGAPKADTDASPAASNVTAPAPAAGPSSPGSETSSSAVSVGGVAGLAGLVLVGGATAWWLRRRRTAQPV